MVLLAGLSGNGDFSHLAIRKMYLNRVTQAVEKKAKNEWEYDLIAKEIGNKDPEIIKRIAEKISEKIQIAILKKRDRDRDTKNN